MEGSEASLTADRGLPDPRGLVLLAVVALIPVERDLTVWAFPDVGDNYHLRVGVSAFHIPLVVLVALTLLAFVRRPRPPTAPFGSLAIATVLWLLVCFALSPSWRGVDVFFHLLAGWSMWDTVRSSDQQSRIRLLWTICLVGVLEVVIAVVQRFGDGPMGVDLLEAGGPFYWRGSVIAVRGSFVHPYHFVGYMLVAVVAALALLRMRSARRSRRILLLGFVAVFASTIAMTFCRSVVLALVPMVIVLVVARGLRLRDAGMALGGGYLCGAFVSFAGVADRASSTVSGDRRSFDTGRLERLRDGWDIIEKHPLAGVGPGNYVSVLRDHLGMDPLVKVLPPHNFVVHMAGEAGLIGGALAIGLLIALAVWAIRGGLLRIVIVISMVPFLLLDLFTYTWQVGFVMSALWLSIADLSGHGAGAPSHPEATAAPQPSPSSSSTTAGRSMSTECT